MPTQASLSKAYTGALWRPGLPPEIYEERPVRAAPRDVRMDVTAFLGLTERGPLATPVPVTSYEEYLKLFGAPGDGRLLGDSVRAFFTNGGRKAVILRVVDAANAATARWTVPALTSGGAPLSLSARNPGVWGNRLAMRGLFRRRRLTLVRPAAATPALAAFEAIATTASDLVPGSLVRFLAVPGSAPPSELRFVTEVLPDALGKRIRFSSALPASIALGEPPPANPPTASLSLTRSPSISTSRSMPERCMAPANAGGRWGSIRGIRASSSGCSAPARGASVSPSRKAMIRHVPIMPTS